MVITICYITINVVNFYGSEGSVLLDFYCLEKRLAFLATLETRSEFLETSAVPRVYKTLL